MLALGPRADAGQQLVAWTVLAHTYFDSGRYAEAEQAYAEVVSRLPANDPQLAEITERRAASVYRQAEARQAAGDTAGAVQEYLRVAIGGARSPAGAKAEFDAAALAAHGEAVERRPRPCWRISAAITRRTNCSRR